MVQFLGVIIDISEDWEDLLHQSQQIIVATIVADWIKKPPSQIAKYIERIELEAQVGNVGWPRLTPFLCNALAERVEDVASWFQAFSIVNLRNDLVLPFQKKWLQNQAL